MDQHKAISKHILFCIFCFGGFLLSMRLAAQSIVAIAKQSSQASLKKNLFHLASEEMEGRLMAAHGDTLASLFVADEFKKAGLTAPYDGGYFQAIKVKRKEFAGSLSVGNATYSYLDGWRIYPLSPFSINNADIIFTSHADPVVLTNYILSHDVKSTVIILSDSMVRKIIADNSIDSLEAIWKSRGLTAVAFSNKNVDRSLELMKQRMYMGQYTNELLDHAPALPGNELPEIGLGSNLMQSLMKNNGIRNINIEPGVFTYFTLKEKLNASLNISLKEVTAPNVIGVLRGKDTTLPVIIVSAHHDHDGKSSEGTYYGSVDNASGTAAIIEMARLMQLASAQGLKPKRTIVFASFTGEERGLLGSSYYVSNPLHPMSKTYGVINIDMMGRVDTFYSGKRADSNYAYILVKDSINNFRKSLVSANDALGELHLDSHYEDPRYMRRRLEGSDQYPFYLKGVPFIRIDCGFAKDYHQLTDTPDKINYELLEKQTRLAFITLWNMANE